MVCDGPILSGPNKGKPARGTPAGATRHHDAGEEPCEPCRLGRNKEAQMRKNNRGNKAGRLIGVGEWCGRLEHRLTGDNAIKIPFGVTCRECKRTTERMRRKVVECTACNRWLTPEAFDAHQVLPPGNPHAPLECLSDEELTWLNMDRLGPRPDSREVGQFWRMKRLTDHCLNGHKRTEASTYTYPDGTHRQCRICHQAAYRRWYEPKPAATHCKNGHERTPENTYIETRRGNRLCRICMRDRQRRYEARKKASR